MKNRPGHINKEDFKRYLNNQMGKQEKHKFERLLEQNPFEYEALEGLSEHDPSVIEKDLIVLQNKISNKKRGKVIWFRIAAIALVLISTGIIFYQINTNEVQRQMVKGKVEEEKAEKYPFTGETKELDSETYEAKEEATEKIPIEKPKVPVAGKEESKSMEIRHMPQKAKMEKQAMVLAETGDTPEKINATFENKTLLPEQTSSNLEKRRAQIANEILPIEKIGKKDKAIERYMKKDGLAKKASLSGYNDSNQYITVSGKVISAGNNEPIPGATVFAKGTKQATITDIEGRFNLQLQDDTTNTFVASFIGMEQQEFENNLAENVVPMEPSNKGIEEVVVIGYGTQNRKDLTGSTSTLNRTSKKPTPLGGFKKYNAYLDGNSILKEAVNTKKTTVRLKLHINKDGTITNIEPLNKPDTTLLKLAQKIIMDGPAWSPATINNAPIDSETMVKIKFRFIKE